MTTMQPGVMAKNNTFAALAARRPQPPRTFNRAELRDRRHKGLPPGHYTGDWSFAREVADRVNTLARDIAADDRPTRFMRTTACVPYLAEAVHEAIHEVVGWVAESDAYAKTAHLAAEPGKRRAATTLLVDMAPRPALPTITDDMMATGAWAAAVIEMAETVDAAFSDLLARSHPPNAPALRGQASRSDLLARLLSRTIDRAAVALERRLDHADHADHRPTAQNADDIARAELAALGVQTG
ncbi:hypothetical protein C3473_27285 [Mycobacterium kansasii]|uniref:hypothetical protein n=1 Tax=Mycobacterium kansasii TaxID=1768 RepID=UPI000CDD7189|nr:hypothetical protein [Mycobacterium kansasii]POX88375.1 hypothetical protein C3473_27285 [Mycobacterium kansasii]